MNEYEIHVEVEPRVHLIRGGNRARFPEANTLLIDDEVLTLVDAGSDITRIERTLNDLGHQVSDIDRIVLTHFHIDHKGHAASLQERSNCEVLCHPLAEKGVVSLEGTIEFYGIGGREHFSGWMQLLESRLPHVMGDYKVHGHFKEGVAIDCGETELIPIHTPGHTHDHTCFGINGRDTLFLVDIDLTRFGPWYGNVVSEIEEFEESIHRVIQMEPKVGISSHLLDPVSDDLVERLNTYVKIFDERTERLLNNIQEGHTTIRQLSRVPTIYPRIPFDVYYTFEEIMLEKHIELLEKRGTIRVEGEEIVLERG